MLPITALCCVFFGFEMHWLFLNPNLSSQPTSHLFHIIVSSEPKTQGPDLGSCGLCSSYNPQLTHNINSLILSYPLKYTVAKPKCFCLLSLIILPKGTVQHHLLVMMIKNKQPIPPLYIPFPLMRNSRCLFSRQMLQLAYGYRRGLGGRQQQTRVERFKWKVNHLATAQERS